MEDDHPLREYRHREGLTLEALAAQVGVQKSALSKIENWLQLPSMDLAARIKAATKGAVTPNDFLLPQKKRRAS